MASSGQAERYKAQGNAALQAGDFKEAVELYTRAIMAHRRHTGLLSMSCDPAPVWLASRGHRVLVQSGGVRRRRLRR